MKKFAALIAELDGSSKITSKVASLVSYFKEATPEDAIWALALFTDKRPKRTINTTLLRKAAQVEADIPEWLFEESYHVVGDLAETIAMLLPPPETDLNISLAEIILQLKQMQTMSEAEKMEQVAYFWFGMNYLERFVFNKLITGGWRLGVSDKLVIRALSEVYGLDTNHITHQLMGQWEPEKSTINSLILEAEGTNISKPYPFFLAYPLEEDIQNEITPEHWQAEYKLDGIRGQIIIREGEIFVWSRGEELVTDTYPEYQALLTHVPNGTVLDGEIICWENGKALPFNQLQSRIGRKTLSKKVLKENPVAFVAYDVLEYEGKDIRLLSLAERRQILKQIVQQADLPNLLIISDLVPFETISDLISVRESARLLLAEGLMLKRKDSPYRTGRKKGDWWKWKVAPLTIDAVMIYAQSGHGRRANLYTDFTFAVWNKDNQLVPFTKAYSGLTDKELIEVDAFVKKNTLDKFGPVRSVKADLVMEIAFEGIQASSRHKSGIALRFPRILRWRKDKPAQEANTLTDLQLMLNTYENRSTIDSDSAL